MNIKLYPSILLHFKKPVNEQIKVDLPVGLNLSDCTDKFINFIRCIIK